MAKVYAQKEGIDYEETFSPTTKWGTIRTLLSMAAQNVWKVHQMDVKNAFLNGDLKENVFMSQPKDFVVKGQENKVCKLVKSLYGLKQAPCLKGQEKKVCKLVKSLYALKQAPRAWYEKLIGHLLKLNFKHYNLDDATLFVKKFGRSIVFLVVYVDDLLMTNKQ